jgi:hypothetical protein
MVFPKGANLDDRWGANSEYRNHRPRNFNHLAIETVNPRV